ncbi:amidohydrolase family protein [Nocardia cerradoensis]|nr:amidohydrolase family protein [Nocardia cerradoensis]
MRIVFTVCLSNGGCSLSRSVRTRGARCHPEDTTPHVSAHPVAQRRSGFRGRAAEAREQRERIGSLDTAAGRFVDAVFVESAVEIQHRGFLFVTVPTPDFAAAATEAERALDVLGADGVVLLANARGIYLGADGQDELFRVLDERAAVAFVRPAAPCDDAAAL